MRTARPHHAPTAPAVAHEAAGMPDWSRTHTLALYYSVPRRRLRSYGFPAVAPPLPCGYTQGTVEVDCHALGSGGGPAVRPNDGTLDTRYALRR